MAFTGTIFHMTAAELERLAQELGLDVVGAAPASAYDETERHIRERKARGLFADMRFTMAQPEVSCHPESLLARAATVISAAHCYYAPEPPLEPGEGRLPTATRYCESGSTRLGGASAASIACSSTRTSTSTARRRHAAVSASTARTRC
jgi:hypothetical protein